MEKADIDAFVEDLRSLLIKHMSGKSECDCWKIMIVEGKLWEATLYSGWVGEPEFVELWKLAHCNVP